MTDARRAGAPSNTHTPNKVTKDAVKAVIAREEYVNWPNSTLTVCVLTMRNGFHVTGESACVDPANFDAQLGRDLAYEEALGKAWVLEAYLLAEDRFIEREEMDQEVFQMIEDYLAKDDFMRAIGAI